MTPDLKNRIQEAIANRQQNTQDPEQADDEPAVREEGKWRLGGFATYFQRQWDWLRKGDATLPVALPSHCLDSVRIARLFRIPLEEFDCFEDRQVRIEHKLDQLVRAQQPMDSETESPIQRPLVEFRKVESKWHARFVRGTNREEDRFPDLLGFRCWKVLLDNPGRRFDPEELERLAGLPTPRRSRRDQMLVVGGRLDVDCETRKVVLDADDPDEAGVALHGPDGEEIADERTVGDLDKDLRNLQGELAVAENPERRQEIEQQIAALKAWRSKLVNRRGKLRPMLSSGKETARKRVRNLLDRARSEIAKTMPTFAQYLAITEEALKYDPAKALP